MLTFKNMSGETSSTMVGKHKKPATTSSDRTVLDTIACREKKLGGRYIHTSESVQQRWARARGTTAATRFAAGLLKKGGNEDKS